MTLSLLANDMMHSPHLSRSKVNGVSAFRYGPFGSSRTVGAIASVPGFNGQRRDPVSDSYHLGNGYRAYNPTLMRFNCPDNLSPFGAGGINPYTYCLGDPVNRADPSGHISWQAGVGIGLGILGIIATAGAAAMAISVAGGIGAALSAASSATLITGGVGVAADVVGIASGAVSDSNPELSATLGWVSMGVGFIGAGSSVASGIAGLSRKTARRDVNINLHPEGAKSVQVSKSIGINKIKTNKAGQADNYTSSGYISHIAGTKEPGIMMHGSPDRLLLDGEINMNLAAVVHKYNAKLGIDLFTIAPGRKIHLIACYGGGENATAQRLATFLGRPVVGYGRNEIIRAYNPTKLMGKRVGIAYSNKKLLELKGVVYYPRRDGLSYEELFSL